MSEQAAGPKVTPRSASARALSAAGGFSALLGLLVLVGWHTHSATLVQIHPAFVPMQYNTALAFLHREGSYANASRPDLILLDLNLPRKDGREVLQEIKEDKHLRRIPVVVLTTSKAEQDILRSYDLHANCYITKPVDLEQFMAVVQSIEDFWLTVVKLPPHGRQ